MANLFKPQISYLLKNGLAEIGSEVTLISEKDSGLIGFGDNSCKDRFELSIKRFGGPIDMVVIFDSKHPFYAPDFIIMRDGQREDHGESYIDYDALTSIKMWNIQDPSSLTKVLAQIITSRTFFNFTVVKTMIPQDYQIVRDIDDMFGMVGKCFLFDIYAGSNGHVYFNYPHSLKFVASDAAPCPVCCISCELDFSAPNEPAKVSFSIMDATEELNKSLSKAVLSKFNCNTSFNTWLGTVDESFKKVLSQEFRYVAYLREFSNVFKTPVHFNPPDYNVMAFGVSDQKYSYPAILKIKFGDNFPEVPPEITLTSTKFMSNGSPAHGTIKDYPYSPRWPPGELASRLKAVIDERYPRFIEHCKKKSTGYKYFTKT